jgi:hypothetical protein
MSPATGTLISSRAARTSTMGRPFGSGNDSHPGEGLDQLRDNTTLLLHRESARSFQ